MVHPTLQHHERKQSNPIAIETYSLPFVTAFCFFSKGCNLTINPRSVTHPALLCVLLWCCPNFTIDALPLLTQPWPNCTHPRLYSAQLHHFYFLSLALSHPLLPSLSPLLSPTSFLCSLLLMAAYSCSLSPPKWELKFEIFFCFSKFKYHCISCVFPSWIHYCHYYCCSFPSQPVCWNFNLMIIFICNYLFYNSECLALLRRMEFWYFATFDNTNFAHYKVLELPNLSVVHEPIGGRIWVPLKECA